LFPGIPDAATTNRRHTAAVGYTIHVRRLGHSDDGVRRDRVSLKGGHHPGPAGERSLRCARGAGHSGALRPILENQGARRAATIARDDGPGPHPERDNSAPP
jgi:hypothetical protein